jgi:hypothetical protein
MSGALLRQFEGMLKILEKIGNATYKLEMPYHMRDHHPIFHMSQLKPCRIDEGYISRVAPSRAPTLITKRLEMEVLDILPQDLLLWKKSKA